MEVSITQLRNRCGELVTLAALGTRVVVTMHGMPAVVLQSVNAASPASEAAEVVMNA